MPSAKQITSGDALEDDFYDDALVVSDVDTSDQQEIQPGEKRKALNGGVESKNKKQKQQKKKKAIARDPYASMTRIFQEPISVQFEYVADRQRRALPDLSSVELEEMAIPESQFVNNEKFSHPEHTLDSLENYIKFGVTQHKKLAKKPEELGMPRVLVLTYSAIRAVELVRALKEFGKVSKIAKLFAKHFKVEEQIHFLQNTPIHVGVGTPNRIKLLTEQGHLKMDLLELVVLDVERNPKNFNMLESDAVRGDLFNFLGKYISPRLQGKQTKIGLF